MSRFFDELEERLRAATVEQHARGVDEADAADAAGWPAACAPPRRRRIRRRPLLAVALAAGALSVPAVGAVTDVWRPDVDPAPAMRTATAIGTGVSCEGPSAKRVDTGPSVGPEFTSVLGVLARPRTAGDAVAAKYLRPLGLVGVDVQGIRRVGGDTFLVPSHGAGRPPLPAGCARKLPPRARRLYARPAEPVPTICLIGGGGGGCTPLAEIRAHGTFGASGTRHGRATVSGLAPSGVREVRVTYGRSTRSFPARDNFFAFEVAVDVPQAGTPDRVEWLMEDGSVRDVTQRHGPSRTEP
ncbi:MAG TPA: hypothetical protein VKB03_14810 [Conexibacter sp.]|nr:hypothetical protein [Conexibacter sp.]